MEEQNTTITEYSLPCQPVTYTLLLTVEIPSVACTIFILFSHWRSMITKALCNHGIFLLTIISLLYTVLDLPFTISFYRLGYNSPKTPSFCLWWYWIDHSILIISLFLTATASVQRHILIFSSLYTIVWTPSIIIAILQALVFPNFYNDIPQIYDLYPFQSFNYLLTLPDVLKFLKSNVKRILARATIAPLVTVSSSM